MFGLKKSMFFSAMLILSCVSFVACVDSNNNLLPLTKGDEVKGITEISSDDPQASFWVAIHADEITLKDEASYIVEIAFGTRMKNLNSVEVMIVSEDFEIIKSCPDIYVINSENYSDEEFYLDQTMAPTFENLPQKFTIELVKKEEKENYFGSIDIKIVEYRRGGYSTGRISLYYYGNNDLICFSSFNQQAAENTFHSSNLSK